VLVGDDQLFRFHSVGVDTSSHADDRAERHVSQESDLGQALESGAAEDFVIVSRVGTERPQARGSEVFNRLAAADG